MTSGKVLNALRRTFCASALLLATSAFAQTDSQPLTLIIPYPPGGSADMLARPMLPELQKKLGRTVVLDYKAGAGGTIATAALARSKPDGNTILMVLAAHAINNALYPSLPYDTRKDFAPVSLVATLPLVVAAPLATPANNMQELIAYAKANPGKLNYASQGNGSVSHIGTEIFKQTTGVDMVHVPYKGSGPAIQDVLAGQVQVFISTPPSLMQHVQSGKLKGLAVTGKNRHPGMPNVPTTAEAGLPSFQLESWVALYAPAGTPAPVVTKLTNAVKQSLALPEIKERSDAAGVELRYLGPNQTDALVKKELPFWNKAIKASNITLD